MTSLFYLAAGVFAGCFIFRKDPMRIRATPATMLAVTGSFRMRAAAVTAMTGLRKKAMAALEAPARPMAVT